VGVLSQGICLLELSKDLSVQISRSGARVPLDRSSVLVGAILNISLMNLVGDIDRLMLIRIVLIRIHAQCVLVESIEGFVSNQVGLSIDRVSLG